MISKSAFFRFESGELSAKQRDHVSSLILSSGLRQFRRHRCFFNAQILAMEDDLGEVRYVEGLARTSAVSVPVHHAWLAVGGRVIDLTWRAPARQPCGPQREKVWGVIPAGWDYVGTSFRRVDIRNAWHAAGCSRPLLNENQMLARSLRMAKVWATFSGSSYQSRVLSSQTPTRPPRGRHSLHVVEDDEVGQQRPQERHSAP